MNSDTTNFLLGVVAIAGVLEVLLFIAFAVMAYRGYQHTARAIGHLEEKQIRPLVGRVDRLVGKVDTFVDEVHNVASEVTRRTDQASSLVARPVNRAVGVARGVIVALDTFFNHRQTRGTWTRSAPEPARGAAERSEHYGR